MVWLIGLCYLSVFTIVVGGLANLGDPHGD